jgi:hypothetical protein
LQIQDKFQTNGPPHEIENRNLKPQNIKVHPAMLMETKERGLSLRQPHRYRHSRGGGNHSGPRFREGDNLSYRGALATMADCVSGAIENRQSPIAIIKVHPAMFMKTKHDEKRWHRLD